VRIVSTINLSDVSVAPAPVRDRHTSCSGARPALSRKRPLTRHNAVPARVRGFWEFSKLTVAGQWSVSRLIRRGAVFNLTGEKAAKLYLGAMVERPAIQDEVDAIG
jgi:hypothetical protein